MYDLQLTAEQLGIRDTVREFVRDEVKPAATSAQRLEPFEKPLLADLLRQASQMGLRTLALSEEAGGAGADNLTSCIVLEELAAGDVDIAATLAVTAVLARLLFDEALTGAQRGRFLEAFVADDAFHLAFAGRDPGIRFASCYHRPAAGAEAAQATAVEQGNGEWVVNGHFPFVANAPVARLYAVQVSARDRAGASAARTVLVPAGTGGMSVRDLAGAAAAGAAGEPLKAWYHGAGGEVGLKDCQVPAHCMLAGPAHAALADGYARRAYVQAGAMNVGVGQAAYEAALEYTRLRRQGGRSIIEHEAIGTLLADMAIRLDASRAMVWRAAWALDHPEAVADGSVSPLPLQHMARAFAAEMMHRVTESAAECFGAMGVMRDMPLQKYVHDSLVFLHGEVSGSASRLLVAEAIAGYERPPGSALNSMEGRA